MMKDIKLLNKKDAFSVAEAMITLLIVSIALSAIAPIFSKRNTAALNGASKWMYTQGGANITRVSGNVGIGVPVSTTPEAKLEIYGNPDTSPFFLIKKAANALLTFTKDGILLINAIDGNATKEGTEPDVRALTIAKGGTATGHIYADGSASFGVPAGAVMFFDLAECPAGWKPLTETYAASSGAYIRNIGSVPTESGTSAEAVGTYTEGNNTPQQYGVPDKVAADSFYAMNNAKEIVPANIALLACKKEAYYTVPTE